jgi:hypothetical protein
MLLPVFSMPTPEDRCGHGTPARGIVSFMDAVARASTIFELTAPAVRRGAAVGVAVLAAVGALLAARRYTGALGEALPLAAFASTALVAGATVCAGRVAWRRSLAGDQIAVSRFAELAFAWTGSIALVLIAVGCSNFGQTQDWVIWLPLIAADQFHRHWFLHGAWFPGAPPKHRQPAIGLYEPDAAANGHAATLDVEGQVLQHLVRVRDAAGDEAVRGTLYAEFAAGQRTATIHVGFCPPLERLPRVEAHAGGLPPAEVKVVQALAHGARLEVRLAIPAAKACGVAVEFSAVGPRSFTAG